jgi:hypothetical protein
VGPIGPWDFDMDSHSFFAYLAGTTGSIRVSSPPGRVAADGPYDSLPSQSRISRFALRPANPQRRSSRAGGTQPGGLIVYEHRAQPILTRRRFVARLARSGGIVLLLVLGSLAIGMLGYHRLARLDWMDAFLNAAMLLGGMGPVDTPTSDAAKLFAGLYALYCGLVVVIAAGILLAPIAHRMLHRFHMDIGK